jgi:hypothetical protein
LEAITTVITTPYPFYFVVVPREASNLSEVRFGDVAVLKQISVLHSQNSWKFSEYLFDLQFLVNMPQVISKLSWVIQFLIWATENPLKIRPLLAVLFWQISATFCVCLFIAFFFSSFDHGTFWEVATVVYALYVVVLSWNLKQKVSSWWNNICHGMAYMGAELDAGGFGRGERTKKHDRERHSSYPGSGLS